MFKTACFHHLLYVPLLIFITGCTVVPEDMKTAERLIETSPDSALHNLQHLNPGMLKSPSNLAYYDLLLARALDKNHLPLKPDTLLDFPIRYYLIHEDEVQLATCYLYKARRYKYALKYESAMDYYLKALDVASASNDNVLLGRIHLDMGDIYTMQDDYALAREKYRNAYAGFMRAGLQPQAFYALLNIGRTWYTAKKYPDAERFFHQIAFLAKDSMQKGALLQEVGLNYYKSKKFDSALFYLKMSIQYPFMGHNLATRYKNMADLYYDLDQPDSAFFYAKNAFMFHPEIRTQRECYRILANYTYLKKDLKAFHRYMTGYQECSDSIRKIDTQTKGSLMESMHNANIEVENTKNKLGALIVFFLMVILAGFFFFFRRNQRHREEKNQLEATHLKQKSVIRKEGIRKRGEALQQKIGEEKLKQSAQRKKASFAEKELLDRKLYDEFLHLNDPDFFYLEMDAALDNLVTKLRTRFPALTTKEINWCCLHLLHVPTTDIYLLLDYKVESLKKMKQRMAQKIGVAGVTKLDDFLNNFLNE